MIFFYQCTTNDGYPQAESDNYFDFKNYPPCDTWIGHIDESQDKLCAYLIAWVPPQFVDQADGAIQGCADESILWVTDLSDSLLAAPVKEALKAANLWI